MGDLPLGWPRVERVAAGGDGRGVFVYRPILVWLRPLGGAAVAAL
jgi:hypothetical protein